MVDKACLCIGSAINDAKNNGANDLSVGIGIGTLSIDEYGNDRLASKNSYTDESNTSLEEVIVEKAADRCVYPRKDNTAPYYHQNKLGYNYITFIIYSQQ